MKALFNGNVIELTEEEREKLKNVQLSKIITDKDRLSAVETAIADLAILLSQNLDNEENV